MRLKLIAATALVVTSSACPTAQAESLGESIAGQWAVVGMTTNANGDIYVMVRKPGEKPSLCLINKPNFNSDTTSTIFARKCLPIN
ncbi:hypothetical protein [Bradyrhizobium sp. DOA9]|uniref:hypothetical protein n=1 Tax=Bradyrhizobium sp. DOA9 TaxID=1126627 RepID=UPI001260262C|nr:hypothetical protein [Bradyrhizobium sp. DOA9]